MAQVLKIGCAVIFSLIGLLMLSCIVCICIGPSKMIDDKDYLRDSIKDSRSLGSSTAQKKSKQTPVVDYDWLLVEAQYAVEQSLKAPSSARFELIDESNISYYRYDDPRIEAFRDYGTVYCVEGIVEAQNSFGVRIRSIYRVDIQFTENGKYVIRNIEIE